MKHTIFLFLAYFFFSSQLFSQNKNTLKIAKGSAVVEWHMNTESKNEAKKRALELAKDNALELSFGTIIVRNVEMNVKNSNTNGNIQTSESIQMKSSSTVKGEIVSILKKEFKDIIENENKKDEKHNIKCTIKVQVRELENHRIATEVYALSSDSLLKPTETFASGSDLFVYFKSPESGYLNIFLDDGNNTARLLPYSQMSKEFENGVPVESDKNYILFSPQHRYFNQKNFELDELVLYTSENTPEMNTLYIVFSKRPLNKPILKSQGAKIKYKTQELELPSSMTSSEFQKWRVDNLSIRSDMQIDEISITIKPL